MRSRPIAYFLLIVIVVACAGYLFAKPNPITHEPLYKYIKLGLDLRGGTHVVLEAQSTPENPVSEDAMRQAVSIVRFRVDQLGVAEPIIQRQGDRRIIVELAGIKDPEQAVSLIGKTAMLKFTDEKQKTIITGKDLAKAEAMIDPAGKAVVALRLKPEAKKIFAEATTENYQKPIFIYLDEDLVQAPIVQAKAIEEPEISGYENLQDAQRVAMLLNSGALPVPLKIIENRILSAGLGTDSVKFGLRAGLVGIVAVLLFMVGYYRLPGAVASFALLIYLLILLGLLIGINATLTLPGIAGVILSLGMAVDANVIIFERIKEEIRNGKTLKAGMWTGFRRAFRTILDSNVTTLIGSGVLFYFGAGPIRGFGLTLTLGIVVSMFTAIIVTRYLLDLLANAGVLGTTAAFVRNAPTAQEIRAKTR